jgi:hypothetical protein
MPQPVDLNFYLRRFESLGYETVLNVENGWWAS